MTHACPKCSTPLRQPFACVECDWRAPPRNEFELTPGAPQVKRLSNMTPEERATARRLAEPHIAKIKEILHTSERNYHGSAMPHVSSLAAVALRGIDYDPEAEAERDAIMREWRGDR